MICSCCANDPEKWRYCICRPLHDGEKPETPRVDGHYKEVCDWCQNKAIGELVPESQQVGHGKLCRKCALVVIKRYETNGEEPTDEARKSLMGMAQWRGNKDGSKKSHESKAA